MAALIRRSSARFLEKAPGRATQHSFSFGAAYDPDRLRFGPMVCHDDHFLTEGTGFETHPHSGLEIVSWVLSGALRHTSASAGSVVVEPGQVAVLSAGSGVEHAEVAAAPRTRFVQVWLASERDGAASYDVSTPALVPGSLVTVAEPAPGAVFSVARLDAGSSLELPPAARMHVYVASGALVRSSLAEPLGAGDAFELTEHPGGTVTAGVPTELLVWSFED